MVEDKPSFESVLSAVKSRGYWRVHAYPLIPPENRLSIPEASDHLKKSAVSLRGWDYPHVPEVTNERNEMYVRSEGWESWTLFNVHREVWRYMQTGQFIHFAAFWEDWWQEDDWLPKNYFLREIEPGTLLDFIGVTYRVTEIYTFLSNLARHPLYEHGLRLQLSLFGVKGRNLTTVEPGRFPLTRDYRCRSESVELASEDLSVDTLREGYAKMAIDTARKVFEQFNWLKSSEEMLLSDQRRLLERRL